VRAELDRHVLPDELPEEHPQRALRRRAGQRPLRGQARDALRLGAGLRRRGADRGRPVDRRLEGRSSWLKVVREKTDPPPEAKK